MNYNVYRTIFPIFSNSDLWKVVDTHRSKLEKLEMVISNAPGDGYVLATDTQRLQELSNIVRIRQTIEGSLYTYMLSIEQMKEANELWKKYK